jgi:hypothetical protein
MWVCAYSIADTMHYAWLRWTILVAQAPIRQRRLHILDIFSFSGTDPRPSAVSLCKVTLGSISAIPWDRPFLHYFYFLCLTNNLFFIPTYSSAADLFLYIDSSGPGVPKLAWCAHSIGWYLFFITNFYVFVSKMFVLPPVQLTLSESTIFM